MTSGSSFNLPRCVDYWETCGVTINPPLIQDSADGIANELLTAGLIVGDDLVAMAANLDKLISTPPSNKQLCFRISSGIAQQETPDERALLGQSSNWGEQSSQCFIIVDCRLCTVEYRGLEQVGSRNTLVEGTINHSLSQIVFSEQNIVLNFDISNTF